MTALSKLMAVLLNCKQSTLRVTVGVLWCRFKYIVQYQSN